MIPNVGQDGLTVFLLAQFENRLVAIPEAFKFGGVNQENEEHPRHNLLIEKYFFNTDPVDNVRKGPSRVSIA